MSIAFDNPWALLLFIPTLVLVWRSLSLTKPGRIPIPTHRVTREAGQSLVSRLWWMPDTLRILALVALILGLARPQTVKTETIRGEGVDIMLALDMSVSMNAVDMSETDLEAKLKERNRELATLVERRDKGAITREAFAAARAKLPPKNRFDTAREILEQFVIARRGDRVGLVVFGPQAWLQYPLTLDRSRLVQTLRGLVLDNGVKSRRTGRCSNDCTVSGNGTAIGDAVGRAFNRLRRSKAKSRIIILITDGKQMGGKLDALAIARHIKSLPDDEQVRVYTFLVGAHEQDCRAASCVKTWEPQRGFGGQIVRDPNGNPMYGAPGQAYPIDPVLLKQIAKLTGGTFYESYDEKAFRADIKSLERTAFKTKTRVKRGDIFPPFLLVGFLLLALEWLLRFTRFRRLV